MVSEFYETATEEESSKLYLTEFEPAFLETSKEFYQAEGQRPLNDVARTFQLDHKQYGGFEQIHDSQSGAGTDGGLCTW
jgi:hypothetical protein